MKFSTIIRSEARKAVNTRAGRTLLGVHTAATILFAVLGAVQQVLPEESKHVVSAKDAVVFGTVPVLLLLPIIAITLFTAEWSSRDAMLTFALVPRRTRVLRAKAALLLEPWV